MTADRFTVTVQALFEARVTSPSSGFGIRALTYVFKMRDADEFVYAYGCAALRAGHYSEDLNARIQDVRNAFSKPGWYTLGRCRTATVERNAKGHLQLVSLERADEKEHA